MKEGRATVLMSGTEHGQLDMAKLLLGNSNIKKDFIGAKDQRDTACDIHRQQGHT
jgi:hypothetical protein